MIFGSIALARVVLGLSNDAPEALYETFPPAEARHILRKLQFHCTPDV